MSSTAPERIWLDYEDGRSWDEHSRRVHDKPDPFGRSTEYIRADAAPIDAPAAAEEILDLLAGRRDSCSIAARDDVVAIIRRYSGSVAAAEGEAWWCCKADYPNHEPTCKNFATAAPTTDSASGPGARAVAEEIANDDDWGPAWKSHEERVARIAAIITRHCGDAAPTTDSASGPEIK